jgi:protein SCO1/2
VTGARLAVVLTLLLALPAGATQSPAGSAGRPLARGGYEPAESPASHLPPALREVGYDQRLGEPLPADLGLWDEAGAEVRLGELAGGRPLVLALVYYDCPMLCTLVLNGLVAALKAVDFVPGRDFEVVAVSFDPREGPELARAKKAVYLERYGRPETAAGWHFLTGEAAALERLTAAAGFRYTFDAASGQFAHPSGILVATPDGRISRYLFGTDFAPRDLRLALVESGAGRVGSFTDQVMLFCFHYDPATGRYSAAVLNLVRAGGVAAVLALALLIAVLARRERRQRRPR